ncbi:MAG: hypothetical protein Ta2F_06020 [Termitinemataceae bacterium]|nr:MAG: hypothetical protein Ta2F_06020 [Termitinemataceae bacterium]
MGNARKSKENRRKSNKVMVFSVFGLLLVFGLLFIGCSDPDQSTTEETEVEEVEKTPKPKTGTEPETETSALAEINKASDEQAMEEALETYAQTLELDLTVYNMLSQASKTATAQYVVENRAYADKNAVQTAFSAALQAAATAEKDLSLKFEITSQDDTDAALVEASFNAVHSYIQAVFTTGTTKEQSIIKLGDYIDLPSLSVAGDTGHETAELYGYINAASDLRLIVIGINSFNAINDNNTPHIVFHFKDIPGDHKMNETDTNTTGYLDSTMRNYIINNFLPGLISAGVPDAVLWQPNRIVASRGDGLAVPQAITDKLWLPTVWEMTGAQSHSVASCETSSNQANFTGFYGNYDARKKSSNWYFLASPSSVSASYFCGLDSYGYASYINASLAGGCVPAFCVQ